MKAVCGLDVHKDSIFLCILHSDGELFEQVFGVLTFQLEGYPMRGKSFSFYRGKIRLLVENKECFVLKVTENTNNIRNFLHFHQTLTV